MLGLQIVRGRPTIKPRLAARRSYGATSRAQAQTRQIVLGIETSCDDTACAIVTSDRMVLGEHIERQDHVHGLVKGITPFVASGLHKENIEATVSRTMEKAGVRFTDLTAIAVTRGPGLGLCLEVGMLKAKALALEYNLPLAAVNHMEGHALISRFCEESLTFPFITVLISGGHTMILVCLNVGEYMQLGTTLDDSIGEAFDKVARDLKLDWEGGGGKSIEKMASEGVPERFPLKEPMVAFRDCNFSFSGIKSQVKRGIESIQAEREGGELTRQDVADISYSFQEMATKHIIRRLKRAIEWCKENLECSKYIKHIVMSGGVASNLAIRSKVQELGQKYDLTLVCPPPQLCTDNGVMIAWAGIENMAVNKSIFSPTEAQDLLYEPRWPLDPSGKAYFPKTHLRRTPKAEAGLRRDITACQEKIKSGHFEEKIYIKGIRSAVILESFDEALEMSLEGLKFGPKNKALVNLLYKVKSRIQTKEFHNSHNNIKE